MVLRISGIRLRPDHTLRELEREICRTLRLSGGCPDYEVMRRSIDARKKDGLCFVYTVDVFAEHPQAILRRVRSRKVDAVERREYRFPFGGGYPEGQAPRRPVVVGSGPSGLFCALMLARAGLCPVVLERGEPVDQRVETVRRFWETRVLNPESNVQFGEGGAGTFSDGKLNTMIRDPDGRIRFVLREFVRAGAGEEILYDHRPHIGTDVLTGIVRKIRGEITDLGGTFLFGSCLTGITPQNAQDAQARCLPEINKGITPQHAQGTQARCLPEINKGSMPQHAQSAQARYLLEINKGARTLEADRVILAIGHSARDTFEMLCGMGFPMQAKAFAVGFRVEHPQRLINRAMYGEDCPYELGAAPYKLTHKCADGRGVYSFCMCPGGYVVNASSEPGMTAVNGMSFSGRDGENANSAIVVTVSPEDYGTGHPLSGLAFQRRLERAAYACAQGRIPVQRFEDFCADRATVQPGRIRPMCKGAYAAANLRGILPEPLNTSIIEGIRAFGRTVPGFDDPDALMSGVESRTSSPVRILRDGQCQSIFPGIFLCGEGAGYAGGITSAAVDGIRVAEAVCGSL